MLCPKCRKEMKIMVYMGTTLMSDLAKHTEVIGRCEDCDFDATWEIMADTNGKKYEHNLKRYYFG